MCHDTLPTIRAFLLCYSLRCGCLTILIWTVARCLFCILFFTTALQDVFTNTTSPFAPILIFNTRPIANNSFYYVFYSYIGLLLLYAVLFIFCIYLGLGVYYDRSKPLVHYLKCRFIAWILEVVFLFLLCLKHKQFIVWYLGMLFVVILEFYSILVVYSYYQNVLNYERRAKRPLERKDADRESVS